MASESREVAVTADALADVDRAMPSERGYDGEPCVADFLAHDLPVILDLFSTQPLDWFRQPQPDVYMLWSDEPATVYDYIITAELRADGLMLIREIDIDPDGSRL